ncbi:MAG TPA: hypothetical protein VJB16_01455 [archaeon]|nr:hypothetical protein [archaeon]
MRVEAHEQAFDVHWRAIFTWALEVEGLANAQRIVGLHASRAAVELLSIVLHKRRLIDEGFQVNHRWFKSGRVAERLPEFPQKSAILAKMVALEIACEALAYGTQKPVERTEEAIALLREIERALRGLL